MPCFFTSPVLEAIFKKVGVMPKAGAPKLIADLALITFGLWIAMPVCCAVYPQYSQIKLDQLEDDIRKQVSPKHQYLLYNKGI